MLAEFIPRKPVAPLLAAALVWCLACSDTAPVEPNPAIDEIYWLSDLQGQIETVVEYTNGALAPQSEQFGPDKLAVAEQLIREQFAPKKLTQMTLARLQKHGGSPFVDETLAWLKTPNVRQVMKAKTSTWSPTGLAGMKSVVEERKENPPSAKRTALIERYDQASGQSEVVQSTIQMSGLAVAVMANALLPAPEQQSVEALDAAMNARRKLIKPFFKEMSTVTSFVYFRDLSDEEIEAFIEFAESEAGKWYYEATSSAFLDSLREVATNLGPAFVAALQAPPSA